MTQNQQSESKWIEANGVRLNYLDWGGAGRQPLLLLHGLQDCASLWNFFACQLSGRYHVLALDHRGHGDSGWADSYGLEDYIGELKAVIEALDLRDLILMGHSAGGKNAFVFAARHPERLASLIINDMDPDAHNPASASMFERYKTETDEYADLAAVIERLRTRQPATSAEILRHCAIEMTKPAANGGLVWKRDRDLIIKYERPDAWEYLPRISVPTLIVRGSDSSLLNPEIGQKMQESIANSRLAVIEGGGHWSYLEQPDTFLRTISEFIATPGES